MSASPIKAGVVLVTKFVTPSSQAYGNYVNYIDRDEATRQEHYMDFLLPDIQKDFAGYQEYMDHPGKANGLFTAQKDALTKEEKSELKSIFRKAQENGSLMWQTVLSFDNRFLEEQGLYDPHSKLLNEALLRELTRNCMGKMLEKEGLSHTAIYSADIHRNTDNIHVHIATVETTPSRKVIPLNKLTFDPEWIKQNNIVTASDSIKHEQAIKFTSTSGSCKSIYSRLTSRLKEEGLNLKLGSYITAHKDGSLSVSYNGDKQDAPPFSKWSSEECAKGKFSQTSIRLGKSAVVNGIIKQDKNLSQINSIIRGSIIQSDLLGSIEQDKSLSKAFFQLYSSLPKNRRLWKYGNNAMQSYRPQIDALADTYIEKYHQNEYQELLHMLDKQEDIYKKAYGSDGYHSSYKEGKLNDLHSRLGNAILSELNQYAKQQSSSFSTHRSGERGHLHTASRKRKSNAPDGAPVPRYGVLKRTPYSPLKKPHYELQNSIRLALQHLKKSLNSEFDRYKNQQKYEQLQYEIEHSATESQDYGR